MKQGKMGNNRAEMVMAFNRDLQYSGGALPEGVEVMNPFQENPSVLAISEAFYQKFYSDPLPRRLILGINPGRLGAGATGIPFTDTKRFAQVMGQKAGIGVETHEPSSVFVYEVIAAYGGAEAFYRDFYINSVCPLGFTMALAGKEAVNYNYYDSKELTAAVLPFIRWNLREQIRIAGRADVCYCLGTGKNYDFLRKLNDEVGYFQRIVPLEHPRFIMQYRSRQKSAYIESWLKMLEEGP